MGSTIPVSLLGPAPVPTYCKLDKLGFLLACPLGTAIPLGGPAIVCALGVGSGGTATWAGSRLACAACPVVRTEGLRSAVGEVERGIADGVTGRRTGGLGDAGAGEAVEGVELAGESELVDLALLRVGIRPRAVKDGRGRLEVCPAFSFSLPASRFTDPVLVGAVVEALATGLGRDSGLSPARDGCLSSDGDGTLVLTPASGGLGGGGGTASNDLALVGEANPPALDATLERRVESDEALL